MKPASSQESDPARFPGRSSSARQFTNRGVADAVRWQPGDRIAMTLTPSAVFLCPAPDGLLRVPPRPCIAIP